MHDMLFYVMFIMPLYFIPIVWNRNDNIYAEFVGKIFPRITNINYNSLFIVIMYVIDKRVSEYDNNVLCKYTVENKMRFIPRSFLESEKR